MKVDNEAQFESKFREEIRTLGVRIKIGVYQLEAMCWLFGIGNIIGPSNWGNLKKHLCHD